jgi:hypothetical protein
MVIPVAQRMIARGHEMQVVALTTAYGPASRAGLSTVGFRDFIGGFEHDVAEYGVGMADGMSAHPDVHPDETASYLGLSFGEVVREHGVVRAQAMFDRCGRQCFLPRQAIRRMIDEIKPDLVLATSSPRAERAAILAARDAGVPALVMVDLMPQSEMEWLKEPGYGDAVCVLSAGVKEALVVAGRRSEEIVVTGNPAFDGLFDLDRDHLRKSWRAKYGFGEKHRVALFASQPDPDEQLGSRVAGEVAMAGQARGWSTVVRPHPNEKFNRSLLPAGTPISDRDDDLFAALCGCDACLVISSSVGLQAAILGVPMGVLDVPVNADPAPYAAMGIGVTRTDPGLLFEAIERGEGSGSFASGPATERVVAVAESLIGGR